VAVTAGRRGRSRLSRRRNRVALGVAGVARSAVRGSVVALLARIDRPVTTPPCAKVERAARRSRESAVRRARNATRLEGADVASGSLGPADATLIGGLARGIAAARRARVGGVERRAAGEERVREGRATVVAERSQVGDLVEQIAARVAVEGAPVRILHQV